MTDFRRQTPLTATPGPHVEGYAPPSAWIVLAAVAVVVVILDQLTVGWSTPR